jgi:choline dehydrogenase
MQYDYVIVGAGSAGCVLANRLSADQNKQVLLIEAGGSDRNPLQRIPAMGVWLNYRNRTRDWCYQTQPDASRHNRTEVWPRGKLLGGTSSLNGLIYVRGAKEDFDHWASLGNEGWSYEEVLPLFKRMEDHEFAHEPGLYGSHYGSGGPLKVRQMRGAHPLADVFVSACVELGIPRNPHYNATEQYGACVLSLNESQRIRCSSSQSFLEPIKRRRNLDILTNTLVTQILLEGKKVVGLRTKKFGHQPSSDIRARQVILSGGVINSPQLLLLSGIGPAAHLKEMGMAVRNDLPGVGENLREHPLIAIRASVNVETLTARTVTALKATMDWLLFGRGPLTSAACHALAFVKTRAGLTVPDAQLHLMPLGMSVDERERIKLLPSCVTLIANVSRSRSRGMLKLASSDPESPPAIDANLLGDEEDVKVLRDAGRLCRQLLATSAFRPFVTQEALPGTEIHTDREWEDFIRETASPACHFVGTCKMGTDRMAVVDPRLKVHGIEGLRVIDASIMPTIPSGNTNAATMMIAEKGAEMILGEGN